MKYKYLLISCILLTIHFSIFSQIQKDILPASFSCSSKLIKDIDKVYVSADNINTIKQSAQLEEDKNGTMMRIGHLFPLNLSILNSGTWDKLEDGRIIWRLLISTQGSQACVLHFNKLKLSSGSTLFVYDKSQTTIKGPYTDKDNPSGAEYSIGLFPGSEIIIEYCLPLSKSLQHNTQCKLEPDFIISDFSYIYRGAEFFISDKANGYGTSEDCEVNINCTEGNNFRKQQKGIARIYVRESNTAGYCTGTLINNTLKDGTPYFLTADHCGENCTSSDFNQWIFKFNYESPNCTATQEPNGNDIVGCRLKSKSPLNNGSDFLFLQLNTTAISIKNLGLIYNGWDLSTTGSTSGVCIHHPSGDIKKVSTYNTQLTTSTYNGVNQQGLSGAHWKVKWTATQNGHGVTEGGSSGSPIFNNNGLVVGTLSGGSSQCSATSNPDYFGKFNFHWASAGTTNGTQIKPWLDPNSSNTTTCAIYDPNNSGEINFSASSTNITPGTAIVFTDNSNIANTTNRLWTFQGGTPTTSTSTNPTVTYANVGVYNVSLKITAGGQTSTATKNGYITVTEPNTSFSYNFENCTDFSVDQFNPCTTYDGDRSATFASEDYTFANEGYTGSFITLNHQTMTPTASSEWIAKQGSKYAACFAATTAPNNDWFITPPIRIEAQTELSFWAKSITDRYGLERFKVLISTNGTNINNFEKISEGDFLQAPTTWNKYVFNLSNYNGRTAYIAIQCISNDAFVFCIDDIVISTQASSLPPIANFYANQNVLCRPGYVNFIDASINNPTSWQWTFEGGTPATSNQKNPSIYYETQGSYKVKLTVSNENGYNSLNRLDYVYFDCSNIDIENITKISIYPNPCNDILNINIPNNYKETEIKIFDILGKEVLRKKITCGTNAIDISNLKQSMYFIEIYTDKGKTIERLNVYK